MPIALGRRALLAAALAFGGSGLVGAAPAPAKGELVYIGMHGTKIRAARFDARTGAMTTIGDVAENLRPTWAVNNPRLPVIYFNEEAGNDGKSLGGVQAFRVDRKSGALTKISDVRAGGGGTTHLWFDAPSNTLLAVNYGGGQLVAIDVKRDGSLGGIVSQVQFTGSGPSPRQKSAHPHGVVVDPSGKWLLVSDLGSDKIWVLPFDRRTRKIGTDDAANPHSLAFPGGTGPRHILFHPSGRWLYLAEELTANVATIGWDARTGRLTPRQSLSTDDPAFTGAKSVGEIAVSRDGRFVYASNRGDHAIAVHAVNPRDGTLTRIQRLPSGGPWPWHIALHSSGRWLVAANRDADALTLFKVDPRSGKLTNAGNALSTPKPVHVDFTGL